MHQREPPCGGTRLRWQCETADSHYETPTGVNHGQSFLFQTPRRVYCQKSQEGTLGEGLRAQVFNLDGPLGLEDGFVAVAFSETWSASSKPFRPIYFPKLGLICIRRGAPQQ